MKQTSELVEAFGVPVLGNLSAMPDIFKQLERDGIAPQRVVITDPIMDGQTVRNIVEIAEKLGLPISRMPQVANLGNMILGQIALK